MIGVLFMFVLGVLVDIVLAIVHGMVRFEYKTSRNVIEYIIPSIVYIGIPLLFLVIPSINYFINADYVGRISFLIGFLLPTIIRKIKK